MAIWLLSLYVIMCKLSSSI